MNFRYAIGGTVILVLVIGGYFVVKEIGAQNLAQEVTEQFEAGDYLAALAAAGKLKEESGVTPELDAQIAEAARFLIAEDAFTKAQKAAEEKRFADAGALLRGSEAVSDPSFKYYEEAQKLYAQMEAFAAGAAHQTAVTISSLESQAAAEKTKRAEAEKQTEQLSGTLKNREAALSETAQKLEQSKQETEAKQSALVAEQARAQQLMEQVEKESKQKFFNELKTYRDMAQKGKEQLDNAVAEISAKRDVTALVYVKQSVSFFEDTKTKVMDMRNNRTPSAYQSRVDDLVRSLEQFLEASKQFRGAVFLIENQSGSDFTNAMTNGRNALANAVSYLSNVNDFIASNQ